MWEAAVNQLTINFIGQIQGMVAQWVDLRPSLMGYEWGGRRRDQWWRKNAPESHLRETLEYIFMEAKKRRLGKRNML